MNSKLIVFIPIFNAFNEAFNCIQSILENTPKEIKIIILDDASTFGDFKSFISTKIKLPKNFIFKRAIQNGGYVKAVNFGFKYAEFIEDIDSYQIAYDKKYKFKANSDLIILNSDTLVTENWSTKLQSAAYSDSNIASVTPYSNNAVLASFPRFCRESNPSINTIGKIANLIEKFSEKKYPELPTAMGFCNYITREAINVIGLYDEKNFGLGNGEENDFSLRARKLNYKCILDDATYIYHVGEVSFADQKSDLEIKHGKVITKLYPHYMDEISKFCSSDPNREDRNNILNKIFKNKKEKPRVLHILNNSINYSRNYDILGGTELHALDLIENIDNYTHCSLSVHGEYYILVVFFENIEREFFIPINEISLNKIINKDLFDLVHFHHSNNFDLSELKLALSNHGNFLVSLHDFNLSCPRNIFITPDSKFCNQFECSSSCGFSNDFISNYRKNGKEILDLAKSVIVFSNSTVELYEKSLNTSLVNIKKIRHGINNFKAKRVKRKIDSTLDILILGSLVKHKGRDVISSLLKHKELANGVSINFHILGEIYPKIEAENLKAYGKYEKDELERKLAEINPHLFFLPSLCAETFSYTLEEALSFGLPALVTSLGAPKERVLKNELGWVLDDLNTNTIIKKLNFISSNNDDYQEKVNNVFKYVPNSIKSEVLFVEGIYKSHLDTSINTRKSDIKFINFFNSISHIYQNEQNNTYLFLGRVSNYVIYFLDYLGIRSRLQNLVYRFLPIKIVNRIKSAR